MNVSMRSVTIEALPSREHLEEVAVGDEAHALVPRLVARLEVRVDVVARRKLRSTPLRIRRLIRPGARRLARKKALASRAFFQRTIGYATLAGSSASQRLAIGSWRGQREDVARRALEHRHVRGALGHRGHERHRGRAAADHDDALARVVEVLGPELRMDDLAGEALGALELRREALVVAVVAAAQVEEVAGQAHGLARVGALGLDRPARVARRPRGAHHAMAEADLALDVVLARRLPDVSRIEGPSAIASASSQGRNE